MKKALRIEHELGIAPVTFIHHTILSLGDGSEPSIVIEELKSRQGFWEGKFFIPWHRIRSIEVVDA